MTSLILQTAARFLLPLLVLFSVFLLLRGHNSAGGGFVGGLISSAAFALYALAFDAEAARRQLLLKPRHLVAGGLGLALSSGLVSLFVGQPFMTSQWRHFEVPALGPIDVSTPLFFDIGVYLVVVGVTLMIIFSLAEE